MIGSRLIGRRSDVMRSGRHAELVVSVNSRLESAVNQYQTTVTVLAGAVGLILLIACVNVAGLLLGRGAARRSELGIRAALGARSSRLARQLLTESFVLCAVGGLVGVLLAWAATSRTARIRISPRESTGGFPKRRRASRRAAADDMPGERHANFREPWAPNASLRRQQTEDRYASSA